MDVEITLTGWGTGQGSGSFSLLSLTERAKIYVARHHVLATRHADTQITLLSARADKWSVPHNFFDNRQTLEQLARLQIIIQEEILMAKKTSRQSDFDRPEWKGFLDYTLNEQELVAADAWKATSAQIWENVNGLLAEGYRLTLSYSANLRAYTATLQAGKEQGAAAGWALSARDAKAEGALKLLLYKHFAGLEQKWDTLLETPKRTIRG